MEFVYFEDSWNNHEPKKEKTEDSGSGAVQHRGAGSTSASENDTEGSRR